MQKALFIFSFLFCNATLFCQIPKRISDKMGMFPIIFLDSIETNMTELNALDPFKISNISIFTPKKAIKKLGDEGSDGAIYVTTVKAAKLRNWLFFKEISPEYNELLNSAQADTIVQYVINRKLVSDTSAVGKLFLFNNKNFRSFNLIYNEK
jgi:hypothetical protein